MLDKVGTYGSESVRMYEDVSSGTEVIALSPPEMLDRAEHFLAGQGYALVRRTATTLTVEREGPEGTLKLVVMAIPQPQGGVRIRVRSDDREGLQERRGLWKLWAENLPKKRP